MDEQHQAAGRRRARSEDPGGELDADRYRLRFVEVVEPHMPRAPGGHGQAEGSQQLVCDAGPDGWSSGR